VCVCVCVGVCLHCTKRLLVTVKINLLLRTSNKYIKTLQLITSLFTENTNTMRLQKLLNAKLVLIKIVHGQTLANKTKPGLIFKL
jgi:hypothetical protein